MFAARACAAALRPRLQDTALWDSVHCNLRLLFILLFWASNARCYSISSPISHPVNFSSHPLISASCISAPIHQYSRLATDCNSAAATTFTHLEHCSTVFSSFHPSCIIFTSSFNITDPASIFSLCSSVVSSLALFLLFTSPQFTIPPSPTPVHTLPCPCCNKNSKTIPICFTCTSKEPPVKVNKRERQKREKERLKRSQKGTRSQKR